MPANINLPSANDDKTFQTRSFASVLFRRMSARQMKDPNSTESKELYFTLLQEQRLAIREKLLQSLNSETVAHVRNKVGDAIAEIAGQYAERGTGSDGRVYPPIERKIK